jgi:hypothetical protein
MRASIAGRLFFAGVWIVFVVWTVTFLIRWRTNATKMEINKRARESRP